MYELSCGDPVGIRTLDLLIRSQSLYPAELPSHVGDLSLHKATQTPLLFGRGRRSRTLNQWFWRPLLYQLSYAPIKISGFLSSQGASPQVLSAFVGLTAVFGMGTGGSLQLSPLNFFQVFVSWQLHKKFFLNVLLFFSASRNFLALSYIHTVCSFYRAFRVSDSLRFVRRFAPTKRLLCLSQALGLLVPVRSAHCCASTPGLSTMSSSWDLTYF